MGVFEVGGGAFLLWISFLPFQNYEQMAWLAAGCLALWLLALLIWRRTSLLSTSLFFHLCLILAFAMRTGVIQGWLTNWLSIIALSQWCGVLWLTAGRPEGDAAPSIFLMVSFLSPLLFPVFNQWHSPFVGFPIWSLLIARLVWLKSKTSEKTIRIPWFLVLLLLICAASIPFSVYGFRNLQFLWVNCICILLYLLLSDLSDHKALFGGYIHLSLVFLGFAFSRELVSLYNFGPGVLGLRFCGVLLHIHFVPYLLILSAFFLYFFESAENPWIRRFVIANLMLIPVLLFVIYSKTGWAAYLLFLAVYLAHRNTGKIRKRRAIRAFLAIGILLLPLLLLHHVRVRIAGQFTKRSLQDQRFFLWNTGIQSILERPWFGAGWFNFYVHSKLSGQPPDKVFDYQKLLVIQSHSGFLEMCEAGGIALGVLSLLIFVIHIRGRPDPALLAGLCAVLLNWLLDGSFFLLPAYIHLWILLGAARKQQFPGVLLPRVWFRVLPFVVLAVSLLSILEDYWLQKGVFLHRNNQTAEAIRTLTLARVVAPLDVVPLEQLKDVFLSLRDSGKATTALQKLMRMKKQYSPYYVQMARMEMGQDNLRAASNNLKIARELDPHSTLREDLYLELASLSFKERKDSELKKYLSLSFLYPQTGKQRLLAKSLMGQVDQNAFQNDVLNFGKENTSSIEDRSAAVDNFQSNLQKLGRADLAKKVLEEALFRGPQLPSWERDNLCGLLSQLYSGPEMIDQLRALLNYVSPEAEFLIQARIAIAQRRFAEARRSLQNAEKYFDTMEVGPTWETYYVAAKKPQDLRKFYQALEGLPITAPEPAWRSRIAESWMEQRKYEEAARAYHFLSLFNYEDPFPHWLETRAWRLAGNREASESANSRLQRLIQSNWFTRNLYRASLETVPTGVGMNRIALPNPFGGLEWRTVIYAHPPSRLSFPREGIFRSLTLETALVPEVWSEKTDGVLFKISDWTGQEACSIRIDPAGDPSQRKWNRLDCKLPGPTGEIVLSTDPVGNTVYDWAVWSVQTAE